jgi:hypothetical protein
MTRSRWGLVLSALLGWITVAAPAAALTAHPGSATPIAPAAPPPAGPIRLGYCGGDDWEPEFARDGAYVFVAITHYVGAPDCDPASANGHAIYLQVSSDGGRTFGAPHPVFAAPLNGITYTSQADPSVTVGPTGDVFVAFLGYGINGGHTDVVVARSTDHGGSFTAASRANSKDCKNCDHEKIVSSGADLYLAYSQAKSHFITRSSDHGATWEQATVSTTDVVAFAEGGVVDAAGNIYFGWADCRSSACTGVPAVDFWVSRTAAGTLTTAFSHVATGVQGPACPFAKCGFAYWSPQSDIAIDGAGTLYVAWGQGQSPDTRQSPPIVNVSRSSDGAQTWDLMGRGDDKTASGCGVASCYALFPTIAAGPSGTVYLAWMDDRAGVPIDHVNGFNVWLRTSTTGGASWTGPSQRMSAYDPSQAQSAPNGFDFPYGDYFGLALNGCGAPMLTWGEGIDWAGSPSTPGHIEFRTLC